MRIKYSEAIQFALEDELLANDNVVLFGEDIQKNLYGYTEGFETKFGKDRIINIPLSEASVVGLACGAAMCGLRPIVDLTVANFLYVSMDQIASIAAKTCYMYSGKYNVPITILCSSMELSGNAAQHSDRLHSLFSAIPGLKVICPSTPQDMYSMLRGAIQDDNPVICFASRNLFYQEEEIDRSIIITPGISKKVEEGSDLTVITVSSCLQMVRDISPELKENGISVEIIDVRTVKPLDYSLIFKSVEKTGKVIICDTASRTGSTASEIASRIQQEKFSYLSEAIQLVTAEDVPGPFIRTHENEVYVTKEKILNKINQIMNVNVI